MNNDQITHDTVQLGYWQHVYEKLALEYDAIAERYRRLAAQKRDELRQAVLRECECV